jgi:hypothetical protein
MREETEFEVVSGHVCITGNVCLRRPLRPFMSYINIGHSYSIIHDM